MNESKMPLAKNTIIGTCDNCGHHNGPLTIEHVIPFWLSQKVSFFGFTYQSVLFRANLSHKDVKTRTCPDCNHLRSGNIEYTDEIVSRFIKAFIFLISEKIRVIEEQKNTIYPFKLIAVCKCHECVTDPVIQEIKSIHNGVKLEGETTREMMKRQHNENRRGF